MRLTILCSFALLACVILLSDTARAEDAEPEGRTFGLALGLIKRVIKRMRRPFGARPGGYFGGGHGGYGGYGNYGGYGGFPANRPFGVQNSFGSHEYHQHDYEYHQQRPRPQYGFKTYDEYSDLDY